MQYVQLYFLGTLTLAQLVKGITSHGFNCSSTPALAVLVDMLYVLDFLYGAQPVKTNSNGCGGNVAALGGTIQYPTFNNYPANTFCKWDVQLPATSTNDVSSVQYSIVEYTMYNIPVLYVDLNSCDTVHQHALKDIYFKVSAVHSFV